MTAHEQRADIQPLHSPLYSALPELCNQLAVPVSKKIPLDTEQTRKANERAADLMGIAVGCARCSTLLQVLR